MPISIREHLKHRPATSKELQSATGLSQVAVSRQLRRMGDAIIKLKLGRSPLYAMTRNAFGGDDKLPLFMVDAHGNSTAVARIRPLAHGGFFVEQEIGLPSVLLGHRKNGLYDDLPYFLDDLRPQGFLGRHIAEEMASQSEDFPSDPRRWNTNHVGRYLTSNGDDLPGSFKFGQQAHLRVRRKPTITSQNDYPDLADSVIMALSLGRQRVANNQNLPRFVTIAPHTSLLNSPQKEMILLRDDGVTSSLPSFMPQKPFTTKGSLLRKPCSLKMMVDYFLSHNDLTGLASTAACL